MCVRKEGKTYITSLFRHIIVAVVVVVIVVAARIFNKIDIFFNLSLCLLGLEEIVNAPAIANTVRSGLILQGSVANRPSRASRVRCTTKLCLITLG